MTVSPNEKLFITNTPHFPCRHMTGCDMS